jgi:hypothetical protein
MLYILALASFALALLLGTLDFVGVAPGAGGTVGLVLLLAIVLLAAQGLLNYSHTYHRHHHAHH